MKERINEAMAYRTTAYYILALALILTVPFACGSKKSEKQDQGKSKALSTANPEKATLAGGCFWCVEAAYEDIHGVIDVVSGYSGGTVDNPTYEQVSAGGTGHAESVQITFDPQSISYWQILDVLWKSIDPTDPDGSFHDRGKQYRPAIFYHNDQQKKIAELSRKHIEELGIFDKPTATEIVKFKKFFPAEEYHQDYYRKNPVRYYAYRRSSGRDQFIKEHWDNLDERLTRFKKPSDEMLRLMLTPIQYRVTQKDGTEPAFENLYWDNKEEGIYVDIVSREPLFSSRDKFVSGTGWPSFTKPVKEKNILEKEDNSLFMKRTEVRSRIGDSHLGHVFNDGPKPTGLRYCMNSASLWFIPADKMERLGYGKYK